MQLISTGPKCNDPELQKVLEAMEKAFRRDVEPYLRWLEDWRRKSERKDVWYGDDQSPSRSRYKLSGFLFGLDSSK